MHGKSIGACPPVVVVVRRGIQGQVSPLSFYRGPTRIASCCFIVQSPLLAFVQTARGLLATDHVILNHGQVTWTTPELAPPLLTTTPHQREDVSALDRFSVHRCPTRRVFSGTGLELVTKPATIRCLYHSATATTDRQLDSLYQTDGLFIGLLLSLHPPLSFSVWTPDRSLSATDPVSRNRYAKRVIVD
ncbi:uncharacterized protein TNCV_4786091 [Trichonephila clavipes]|nr:uncharacterized protein TNCV_4786091 [Trichonephila clavipes]